jgi:hypothetical protein
MTRLILIAAVLGSLSSATAGSACLRYEPEVVTISGELLSRTFAGPPEYLDVKNGDRPETVLLLLLDEPLCVQASPRDELNSESVGGVVLLQVLPGPSGNTGSFVGKHVAITGKLSHAISGHHRTDVLVEPQSVVVVKPVRSAQAVK